MAKSIIQFQKSISLQEFLSQFGSEEQCRAALFHWRWPQGYICSKCGHGKYCQLQSRKLFQCNNCRFQLSLTDGTIFENTKLPLSVWFLAIYFITQSKKSMSALGLMRTIGVSYNRALLMKHKILHVMKEQDDNKPLTQFVHIDDAYWGGKKRDGIRGRRATGKIPFVAAVSTNEERHPLQIRFSQVESFTKGAIEVWADKHLAPGSKIISDGYGCF